LFSFYMAPSCLFNMCSVETLAWAMGLTYGNRYANKLNGLTVLRVHNRAMHHTSWNGNTTNTEDIYIYYIYSTIETLDRVW
jgi:hypothetical protein